MYGSLDSITVGSHSPESALHRLQLTFEGMLEANPFPDVKSSTKACEAFMRESTWTEVAESSQDN